MNRRPWVNWQISELALATKRLGSKKYSSFSERKIAC